MAIGISGHANTELMAVFRRGLDVFDEVDRMRKARVGGYPELLTSWWVYDTHQYLSGEQRRHHH
jgi:hypothetical protein